MAPMAAMPREAGARGAPIMPMAARPTAAMITMAAAITVPIIHRPR
jgi:hypothetical protein